MEKLSWQPLQKQARTEYSGDVLFDFERFPPLPHVEPFQKINHLHMEFRFIATKHEIFACGPRSLMNI